MDARQERGLQLAQRGHITKHANGWRVLSQTGNGSMRMRSADQPRQGVIHNDGGNYGERIGGPIVCSLDIGCVLRVKIQPRLAENGIPAEADELMDDDQDPNCEMVNTRLHGHKLDRIDPSFTRPKFFPRPHEAGGQDRTFAIS